MRAASAPRRDEGASVRLIDAAPRRDGRRRPALPQSSLEPDACEVSVSAYIMLVVTAACALAAGLAYRAQQKGPSGASSGVTSARARALSRLGTMSCGGAHMCGVLSVESGLGVGYYKHDAPAVHGLWPQTPPFGTSPCIPPASMRPRKAGALPDCFDYASPNPDHERWFVEHEWVKHGVCAGVASEDDYYAQICELSAAPLAVMAAARAAGGDFFKDVEKALKAAGFPVYWADAENGEVALSACAVRDRRGAGYLWRLAPVGAFPKVCGRHAKYNASAEPECVPSVRGPACKVQSDCDALRGCLRCTRAGYCTSIPARVGK